MARRQAERAKLAALLADSDDEFESEPLDESVFNETTEKILGKDSNDMMKRAFTRIGGDLVKERGYVFFQHTASEREFDTNWIKEIPWLEGFDGTSTHYMINGR
jgi:hypothetical protein